MVSIFCCSTWRSCTLSTSTKKPPTEGWRKDLLQIGGRAGKDVQHKRWNLESGKTWYKRNLSKNLVDKKTPSEPASTNSQTSFYRQQKLSTAGSNEYFIMRGGAYLWRQAMTLNKGIILALVWCDVESEKTKSITIIGNFTEYSEFGPSHSKILHASITVLKSRFSWWLDLTLHCFSFGNEALVEKVPSIASKQ